MKTTEIQNGASEECAAMAARNGYRVATHGDLKATHAICRHGYIVPADADDHTCSWSLLVSNDQAEPQPRGEEMPNDKEERRR